MPKVGIFIFACKVTHTVPITFHKWWSWCKMQISRALIRNYASQYYAAGNHLTMSYISASGMEFLLPYLVPHSITNYPGSFEKRTFVKLSSCTTGQMKNGDLCRAFVRQIFEKGIFEQPDKHLWSFVQADICTMENSRNDCCTTGHFTAARMYKCPFSTAHCTNVRLYKYPVWHVSVVQLAVVHVWVVEVCEHLHSYICTWPLKNDIMWHEDLDLIWKDLCYTWRYHPVLSIVYDSWCDVKLPKVELKTTIVLGIRDLLRHMRVAAIEFYWQLHIKCELTPPILSFGSNC